MNGYNADVQYEGQAQFSRGGGGPGGYNQFNGDGGYQGGYQGGPANNYQGVGGGGGKYPSYYFFLYIKLQEDQSQNTIKCHQHPAMIDFYLSFTQTIFIFVSAVFEIIL